MTYNREIEYLMLLVAVGLFAVLGILSITVGLPAMSMLFGLLVTPFSSGELGLHTLDFIDDLDVLLALADLVVLFVLNIAPFVEDSAALTALAFLVVLFALLVVGHLYNQEKFSIIIVCFSFWSLL